jgi:hypothetical protein
MYQAAVLLDFRGTAAEAELQLPAERLQSALGTELSQRTIGKERARITEYVLRDFSASLADGRSFRIELIDAPRFSNMDGAPYVVTRLRLVPPGGSGAEQFDLHCDVLLDRIPSQVILVSIRTDWRTSTFANDPQLLAVFRGPDSTVRVDRANGNWWNGFGSVFRLGMRHIAEGTDHLLFLLALLLPAPLLAGRVRWKGYAGARRCLLQIGKVVTAFTAGHSVTLAAGAMNLVHVPAWPIEVLIAFSIFPRYTHCVRSFRAGNRSSRAVSAWCTVWPSPRHCPNSVWAAGRELPASSGSILESRPCS